MKPRDLIKMSGGSDVVADLWKYKWDGGFILYRWDNSDPKHIFANGFTKDGGHDDLKKHLTEKGIGSNYISCSMRMDRTMEYSTLGRCFEIELTHPHTKAFDANAAMKAISGKVNPFFGQCEISVYKKILPSEVVAVWLRIDNPKMKHDNSKYEDLLFAEQYERFTRSEYLARNG